MKIETTIEFDKVKMMWMECALTQWAKEQIESTMPYLSEIELDTKLRETSEARLLIEKGGNPPLVSLEGLRDVLMAANQGACLSPNDLETVEKALVAVRRLKDYFNRCKQYNASLPYYEENLDPLESIRESIAMQIRGGRVDDHASKLLLTIRNDIARTESRMKEKADAIMRSAKDSMSDHFSTFRNGRLCVPVKKECKFKISGSVIDKSSTGNTLFIEPTQVAKYYEELQLLRIDEENEERRILYVLASRIADCAEEMEQNIKMIEKMDFIFSKGKLSVQMDAIEPTINTERKILLKEARHPLMDRNICVPLNFQLGDDTTGIVITGPNTGGKTVALKTVAINCMMAQCGLHVTCKEAQVCMNSSYLCDIGDGQNLAENLSTFSAHIVNVLDILKKVTRDSLVIMDELGSGTDPTEGMGIAIAILEELRKSGCLFLVTTHYPEVKQYAERTEGIVNAKMTFDKESLKPLYQMVIGEAGESCAFYIASRLGMPGTMLKTAIKAAYGEEKMSIDLLADNETELKRDKSFARIQKKRKPKEKTELSEKYHIGDSVMVFPDKKIGIVCEPVNEKGVLRVQMPNKKIWINHKRVKLHVAASELYPEDYDFSILFETAKERKIRHDMSRKYMEGVENIVEE